MKNNRLKVSLRKRLMVALLELETSQELCDTYCKMIERLNQELKSLKDSRNERMISRQLAQITEANAHFIEAILHFIEAILLVRLLLKRLDKLTLT